MLAAGQDAGVLRSDVDLRTIFFLLTDGGAGPYTSRPFAKPEGGRIAVKVINHLGDEVMKVFSVGDDVGKR